MDNRIYITRMNKDEQANSDDIRRFEKSAISEIGRGKKVFIIEKFPQKFFQLATRVRIEKTVEKVASLSAASNAKLFKVLLTGNICD